MNPLISIFTPTHKPKYLEDLWKTIARQSYTNFEWVIVFNGPKARDHHKRFSKIFKDERIRLLVYMDSSESRIGTLKRWACHQCKGDVLAEVDHDDLLSDDCLEKVMGVFNTNPEVGFVYSDFAEFYDKTWTPQTYLPSSGWEVYPVRFEDKDLLAHKAPEPDARSVCQIEFAPNHIRAWRTDVYKDIGGHADLKAGDDHELVIRTYLKTKMKRIPECLYFYRRLENEGNSYRQRYDEIRKQESKNRNTYMYKLMERWSNLQGLLKVDLGAAHGKPDGFIGVDILESDGVDKVCDVSEGLPFEDNSVGLVRAVDFLEHIPDKISLINEIYRVLAPGGWLMSITPSTDGRGAFQDPTHVAYYNENSFWYYTDKNHQKFVDKLNCKFQATRLFTAFPSNYHKDHNISYVYADLCAIKDNYRPCGIVKF